MATRAVVRKSSRSEGPGSVVERFRQWAGIKNEVTFLKNRQDKLRDELMTVVQSDGEPDDKGNVFLPLPTEVEVGGKKYGNLKAERRASSVFMEDKAEELLSGKGLLERAQKTIVVLDHDEVYLMHQEGLITEEEIDSLFQEKVTYAFVPVA